MPDEPTTVETPQPQRLIIKDPAETQVPSQPATTEPPAGAPETTAPETTTPEQPSFDAVVAEKTGGQYKTFDDFVVAHGQTNQKAGLLKDEFIEGAARYYAEHGTLAPYVEVKSVNWDEQADEAVLRADLRKQHSGLDDKTFERLWQKQVVEKYSLDPDTYEEEDVNLGKALLKQEADKLRTQFKEAQAKMTPPDRSAEVDQNYKAWSEQVSNDPATTALRSGKTIAMKENFSYAVEDPEAAVSAALNTDEKFWPLFLGDDGKVDLAKFYRVFEYARNPEKIEQALIEHGKTLGTETVIGERTQQVPPGTQAPTATPQEGMAGLGHALAQAAQAKKN